MVILLYQPFLLFFPGGAHQLSFQPLQGREDGQLSVPQNNGDVVDAVDKQRLFARHEPKVTVGVHFKRGLVELLNERVVLSVALDSDDVSSQVVLDGGELAHHVEQPVDERTADGADHDRFVPDCSRVEFSLADETVALGFGDVEDYYACGRVLFNTEVDAHSHLQIPPSSCLFDLLAGRLPDKLHEMTERVALQCDWLPPPSGEILLRLSTFELGHLRHRARVGEGVLVRVQRVPHDQVTSVDRLPLTVEMSDLEGVRDDSLIVVTGVQCDLIVGKPLVHTTTELVALSQRVAHVDDDGMHVEAGRAQRDLDVEMLFKIHLIALLEHRDAVVGRVLKLSLDRHSVSLRLVQPLTDDQHVASSELTIRDPRLHIGRSLPQPAERDQTVEQFTPDALIDVGFQIAQQIEGNRQVEPQAHADQSVEGVRLAPLTGAEERHLVVLGSFPAPHRPEQTRDRVQERDGRLV